MRRSFLIAGMARLFILAPGETNGRGRPTRVGTAPVGPGPSAWGPGLVSSAGPQFCSLYRPGEEPVRDQSRRAITSLVRRTSIARGQRFYRFFRIKRLARKLLEHRRVAGQIPPRSEIGSVEGITTIDVAGDQTLAEPLDPLGRGAVRERVGNHVALGLLLKRVVADPSTRR